MVTWGGDGNPAAVVPAAVDEAEVRFQREPVDGPNHSKHPGVEDVHLVDLLRRGKGDAPRFRLSGNETIEGLPFFLCQLLGIVEAGDLEFPWQYDGGGVNRPRQGARSRLVHAAQDGKPAIPLFPLRGPQVHA
jgi:hypothetical protein